MKKRDLENFDFIKSKFDEAIPEIPLTLDERMIERKKTTERISEYLQVLQRAYCCFSDCFLRFIKEMICLLLLILLLRLKHLKIMMS